MPTRREASVGAPPFQFDLDGGMQVRTPLRTQARLVRRVDAD
jgi:hypothetical protein